MFAKFLLISYLGRRYEANKYCVKLTNKAFNSPLEELKHEKLIA